MEGVRALSPQVEQSLGGIVLDQGEGPHGVGGEGGGGGGGRIPARVRGGWEWRPHHPSSLEPLPRGRKVPCAGCRAGRAKGSFCGQTQESQESAFLRSRPHVGNAVL